MPKKKTKTYTLTSIGHLASIDKLLPHHSHGGKKEVHEKQKSKLEEWKESLNKKIKDPRYQEADEVLALYPPQLQCGALFKLYLELRSRNYTKKPQSFQAQLAKMEDTV